MSVRSAIEARLAGLDQPGEPSPACLPAFVKPDRINVRTAMLQRLAASRLFARGDRAGVLKATQNRSGRTFRLDVRQKVIVKALVSRHSGVGAARGAVLGQHLSYLGRGGAGQDGARPELFDRSGDAIDAKAGTRDWAEDRHHFRFIISPEHGDRIADLRGYTREVMARVSRDLGQPDLPWVGVCHFDTDQPHAHVVVRGRRASGKDLVIPRDYIGYGFRARAQGVAHERLGDLSRTDAERRVWRDTQAERFTGLDRRLIAAAGADGLVPDPAGQANAWVALSRGRLLHLERLGLAERVGAGYRLDSHLEGRLRSLQVRRDVIRTLNQRRLEGARTVRELGAEIVQGRVVATGRHDEIGASPFVVVKDQSQVEHYARLAPGRVAPDVGTAIQLKGSEAGLAMVSGLGRAAGLER